MFDGLSRLAGVLPDQVAQARGQGDGVVSALRGVRAHGGPMIRRLMCMVGLHSWHRPRDAAWKRCVRCSRVSYNRVF